MKKLPKVPVAELIGFKMLKAAKGSAVCTLKTEKKHENPVGTIHGGILCDLADATMGLAFMSLWKKGDLGATVEFKINFLKPVYAGDQIRALAQVLSQGKSLFYIECTLKNQTGALVAKSSSTCKILAR